MISHQKIGIFHYFSHYGRASILFALFSSSLYSISEPKNQVYVLGAINERYEALCNVCMCLKGSVKYGQTVGFVFFFHKTECVNMVLRILNLKGEQHCMISSKVTTILPLFLFNNFKHRQVGCLSRDNRL